MNNLRKFTIIAVLTCGLAGAAAAQEHDHQMGTQAATGDAAYTKDLESAHTKMMRDMMVKPSGSPDVDFVRGMIPHHQGAIDMAKVQLEHGKDPELLKMAKKIIADQEKEIADMKEWLAKHGK